MFAVANLVIPKLCHSMNPLKKTEPPEFVPYVSFALHEDVLYS